MAAQKTKTELENEWGHTDPFDWVRDMLISIGAKRWASVTAVTFGSATQTLRTVPANSLITGVKIIRTTAWDAITTFEVGKTGTTDWLATTAQANVTGAIAGTEEGEVESVDIEKVAVTATPIILTLDQGAAAAGAGFVIIEYQELT